MTSRGREQAQAGEESAIAALITAMMSAIRKGAAAVAKTRLNFDDAVQEGLDWPVPCRVLPGG